MLSIGDAAPDFTALADTNQKVRLNDFLGSRYYHPHPMRTGLIASLLLFTTSWLSAQGPDSTDFLAGLPDFREVRTMLPAYLNRLAMAQLEERARKVALIKSEADVAARRAYIRERMLLALGGLPERTSLNPRVTGVLDRDGYKVEKVIFESQPGLYVVANLYLPKTGRPPYPAVLFPLGHEAGAKSHFAWQQVLVTLAKRGFVALAWDPVGQGERVQLYDADFGDSKVFRSTTEHTMLGVQCLLVGDNLARYTIWDGIRALDYLLSRPEVDRTKIAVTGNSGGGTHTAYLAALDDRIHVAAPSCYLTSWRRLLESIGPQDAEQCLPPWLQDGLDHADFIYAFAPKPYVILSAIRDFFSISGARETYEEARRLYSLLGAGDKLSRFEADDGHGYTKPRRHAAYRWFSRWLQGAEDTNPEPQIQLETEETLQCTSTSQVATSLGGETVFSLNLKRAERLRSQRQAIKDVLAQVRQLTGFKPRQDALKVRPFGRIQRQGYSIEKLIYEPEPGVLVPALLFLPENRPQAPAFIYVHERGKSAGAGPGGEIEELVKSGFAVLAIDARGWGETRPDLGSQASDFPRYFGDYHSAMKALLTGRTLVGMRAEDIVRGVDLLATRPQIDRDRIYGFGRDAGAVALLHAAALDARIKKVALEGMLLSYESVVGNRIHRGVFESAVQGVLKSYDLPDLVRSLQPRPVWMVNSVGPAGQPAGLEQMRKQYGATAGLTLTLRRADEGLARVYSELLK